MKGDYFADKVVWVTGASSGLGKAIAIELGSQAALIILSGRNENLLQEVSHIVNQSGRSLILPFDLADDASIDEALKFLSSINQTVDIVFHAGGLSQRSLAVETEVSVVEYLMKVNFLSTVRITKALLPRMVKRGFGQFVLFSSVAGKSGVPYRCGYSASKHALHGFYDTLRAEMEDKGIRVTILCPGYIYTDISVNAMTGDGNPQNQMDENQRKGMKPAEFAKIATKAVEKNKAEIYIGGKEIFAIYLKRFFPGMLRKILKNVSKP